MAETRIEWSDMVWNPITGCDRVSPGCDNCYALTLAARLKAMGQARYQTDGDPRTSGPGFGVALHPESLGEPLRWRKPRRVFVNSMSDLFHKDVPDEYIGQVFAIMGAAPQHTFQVLTKRPGRMASLLRNVREPLPNVWLGTSVESYKWAVVRVPQLMRTPAAVRFLSCEPLLDRVDLALAICHATAGAGQTRGRGLSMTTVHAGGCCQRALEQAGLHWIIAGGESGPGHRPMDLEWVRLLRDQAAAADIAFFFKQVGGRTPKAGGRLLDGREWSEFPAARDRIEAQA